MKKTETNQTTLNQDSARRSDLIAKLLMLTREQPTLTLDDAKKTLKRAFDAIRNEQQDNQLGLDPGCWSFSP